MPLPELSLTSIAGLMAAAALVGGAWQRILDVLKRMSDLVICRATVLGEAGKAMSSYIWQRGKRSPFAVRLFSGQRSYVQPKKRIEVVAFEAVSGAPMLFWFGWAPMVVKRGGQQFDGCTFSSGDNSTPMSVWFIRGTLDLDAIMEEATVAFNQLVSSGLATEDKPRRFNVHRVTRKQGMEGREIHLDNGGGKNPVAQSKERDEGFLQRVQSKEVRLITWRPDDLIERANDQPPFDLYPFPEGPLSVLPQVERWLKHETWFRSRGIPWRRGILCSGSTGTGKSTFVRSVAIKHDLPLYVFDLASLDNQSFISEWQQVQQNTPAIVLLEDFDCVFRGREFVATVSKNRDTLTFDCLLNTISGVGSSDGILLFITTNHVETLDPALGIPVNGHGRSSRPGRIDHVVHFGPMEEEPRLRLARFILSDYPDEIAAAVVAGDGESAAQFQERCAQIALAKWEQGRDPQQVEPPPDRAKTQHVLGIDENVPY